MQYVIGYSKFGVRLKSLNTELVRYMNSTINMKGLIINIIDHIFWYFYNHLML